VRAAAGGLDLHTDASHRFERGADPEICRAAADRAAALIVEVAGGEVLAGALDARAELPLATAARAAGAAWPPRGRLSLAGLDAFAGAAIARADVERWLAGLGFAPEPVEGGEGGGEEGGGPVWRVTVPSWRWYDLVPGPGGEVYPADLYEEAIRLHGFDRVPAALPEIPGSDGPRTPAQLRRDRLRRELAGYGWAEAINFAFHSAAADAAFPAFAGGRPLELANPLSERHAVLRRSLVPNLVDNARFNRRRGAAAVRLFEIGRVFAGLPPGETGPDGLPVAERETVAMVAGGAVGTPWERRVELDLFDLKGAVEGLGEALGTPLAARPAGLPGVVPGTGARLFAAGVDRDPAGGGPPGEPVGWLGRIDDPEADPADPPLYAAELAADALGDGEGGHGHPVGLPSRFPGIGADFTLTHPLSTPWAEIAAAVEAHRPADLAAFGLKDRYAGEGVPPGAVNTTLWFVYVSPERSLTQEEVNLRQRALTGELERRFAARPGAAEEGDR
jgi:phenylalanyl-tRNA synthetase beta chain